MKRKIFFLADSAVDLRFAYISLKKRYKITWVYYHKNLKFDLLKIGCKKSDLIFLHCNSLSFLLKKFFCKFGLFKINYEFEAIKKINIIDKKKKPDLWITDTGNILSKLSLSCPKVSLKHSVPYKNYFLSKNIFEYDYIIIPGEYHLNRILFYYPERAIELKKKLIIGTSSKILPYFRLKNNNNIKNQFLKSINFSKKKKIVLLAPTHDSFSDGRFLPKKFNKENQALKKLCKIITEEFNCYFIIKLHHYHSEKLKNKEFNFLDKLDNVYVFKSSQSYNNEESEKVFFSSDIVITDTSGVGPICCYLNKNIIYLDPDDHFDWKNADIEKKLRPGFILNDINKLGYMLGKYINNPSLYKKDRRDFCNKIFKYRSSKYANLIQEQVKKILKNR